MIWTQILPKKEGWYWHRDLLVEDEGYLTVHFVTRYGQIHAGATNRHVSDISGWWSGPFYPPELP